LRFNHWKKKRQYKPKNIANGRAPRIRRRDLITFQQVSTFFPND
jgi:hypothetical protein